QSVDSSSYVKLAANGRLWGQPDVRLPDASPTERLHLALCNLAMATQRALPLSTSHLLFGSRLWEHPSLPAGAHPITAAAELAGAREQAKRSTPRAQVNKSRRG